MFILDEADELLSSGFRNTIYDIFQLLPSNLQVGLFSATLSHEALEIAEKFMNKPVKILVKKDELTIEGIRQFYVNVENEDNKLNYLCDMYENLEIIQSVIFVNTKEKAIELADSMRELEFSVSCIHGDMKSEVRKAALKEFKSNSTKVLITTDLLARGIDIQQVKLVINFDLPKEKEKYLHRIGRSGRFGKKGMAINFVCRGEERILQQIQHFYKTTVEELPAHIQHLI